MKKNISTNFWNLPFGIYVSSKLKIIIGSEMINIDDAVLLKNGRRNLLPIIDLLDNNIVYFTVKIIKNI